MNSLVSRKKMAQTAGWSLIIMALAAGFAYGYVYNGQVVPNDPATTFRQIQAGLPVFRAGIGAWVLIFLCDVVVALALYGYFKSVHQQISLLTAAIRLVYTAVLGWAISQLIIVTQLIKPVAGTISEDLAQQVLSHLENFERIWSAGLIIFGLHLVGLGYLAFRSRLVPRVWGVLLVFAGICYTFLHGCRLLPINFDVATLEMALSLPMAVAELGLAIWLLRSGRKTGAKVSLEASV